MFFGNNVFEKIRTSNFAAFNFLNIKILYVFLLFVNSVTRNLLLIKIICLNLFIFFKKEGFFLTYVSNLFIITWICIHPEVKTSNYVNSVTISSMKKQCHGVDLLSWRWFLTHWTWYPYIFIEVQMF